MRYVIAVGGNAITKSSTLSKLSSEIARLFTLGSEIVITHGNGPQVGELASKEERDLASLTEETEIQMGGKLLRSISAAMRGKKARIVIVLTRVLVDKKDREFKNPSKPIGRFYDEKEAEASRKKGFTIKRLLNGYRRVVPSPKPIRILELERIEKLLKEKAIVIAAGGGGMAVVKRGSGFRHADAVIDKDYASSLLAERIGADRLLILTNVDAVYLNFKKKNARMLGKVSARELQKYSEKGYFEPGSMLPKVRACIDFVKKTRGIAAVGNLQNPKAVFNLRNVTVVTAS